MGGSREWRAKNLYITNENGEKIKVGKMSRKKFNNLLEKQNQLEYMRKGSSKAKWKATSGTIGYGPLKGRGIADRINPVTGEQERRIRLTPFDEGGAEVKARSGGTMKVSDMTVSEYAKQYKTETSKKGKIKSGNPKTTLGINDELDIRSFDKQKRTEEQQKNWNRLTKSDKGWLSWWQRTEYQNVKTNSLEGEKLNKYFTNIAKNFVDVTKDPSTVVRELENALGIKFK